MIVILRNNYNATGVLVRP